MVSSKLSYQALFKSGSALRAGSEALLLASTLQYLNSAWRIPTHDQKKYWE